MRQTFQFHNDQVLTNAVVAAALGSDAPLGIGVQHGWRKVGAPMIVTNSAKSRVYTLDDEPALDVYLRRLNAPSEAHDRSRRIHPFRPHPPARPSPAYG